MAGKKQDNLGMNILLSQIAQTKEDVRQLEGINKAVEASDAATAPIVRMRRNLISGGFTSDEAFAIVITILQNAYGQHAEEFD